MRSIRHQVALAIWIVAVLCLMLLPGYAAAEVDITDKVEIIQGRMVTDRATGDALIDVSVRNVSNDVLLTPVRVAITSVSSAGVLVADFDGVTSEGFPYYEYESATGQLLASETIPAKRWRFENPTKVRFTYTTKVLGFVPDKAEVVGPSGGIIETDTGVVLEIPSGSVLEAKTFTVTREPEESLELTETIDNAYLLGAAEFGPSGQQFEWPVKITIPLKEGRPPGEILPLYIFSESQRNFHDSGFFCEVSEDGLSCSGMVTHFTTFGPAVQTVVNNPWYFGNNRCVISDEDAGNCAYFIQAKNYGLKKLYASEIGPRLPNNKRNSPEENYLVWGTSDPIYLPPSQEVAARLYSSISQNEINEEFQQKEPIIFIHGYQKQNSFGGGKEYWGNFFNLINDLKINERAFLSFDFQWRTNARFQDVAEDLYDAIKFISEKMDNQKVHIVAHSFGGIVVRTMLQNYFPEGSSWDASNLIASVTTIGTPHSGIADSDEFLYDREFPKGQDSPLHEGAGQISVYQMGEGLPFTLSNYFRDKLGLSPQKGEIAYNLAYVSSNNRIPDYVPIQVTIGLTAIGYSPLEGSFFLESGDKLISYEGQRFHPELTTKGILPLLSGQNTPIGGFLSEKLLGLNGEHWVPGEKINVSDYEKFKLYGFKHSPKTPGIPSFSYRMQNVVNCEQVQTCNHDSFLSVKNWLERYTSDPDAFDEITRYSPAMIEPSQVQRTSNYKFSAENLDQLINSKMFKYCLVINDETNSEEIFNTCGETNYDGLEYDSDNPEWIVDNLVFGNEYSWAVFAVNPYNQWSYAQWWTFAPEEDFVTISGRVIDASTNQGVGGAVVSTSLDYETATTNPDGTFSLQTSTEAIYSLRSYTINVSAEGYETFSSEGIWGDHPENQTFNLTPIITVPGTVWDDHLDIGVPFYNVFFEGGEWKIITFELTSATAAQATFDGTTYNGTWAVDENEVLNITVAGPGASYWKLLAVDDNRLNICFAESLNGLNDCDDEFFYFTLEDAQSHDAGITLTSTLPDTGQTMCYNTEGAVIDCAGTGQDGEFSINPMSYTDNGDGTVTDNVTGLIWQQGFDGFRQTWEGAINYCQNLSLGGSNNWRLPTRRELIHIVDYGRIDPAINPLFNAGNTNWSSSSYASNPANAWMVNLDTGHVHYGKKSDAIHGRCVR